MVGGRGGDGEVVAGGEESATRRCEPTRVPSGELVQDGANCHLQSQGNCQESSKVSRKRSQVPKSHDRRGRISGSAEDAMLWGEGWRGWGGWEEGGPEFWVPKGLTVGGRKKGSPME